MRKVHWEIIASVVFVLGVTLVVYGQLKDYAAFWDAQNFWSIVLIIGYGVVAAGYYRQGWLVHHNHSAANVSILLPVTVVTIQCLLFIKGIYFNDWSLIVGALIVNSGVVFELYQTLKADRIRLVPRWTRRR
jgi:hypothetical protein